jgi:ketosteroid isomerase-like protein
MSPSQAQSPKQLVQSMYEAFSRGDIQTILAALAPDADWDDSGPAAVPFAGRYRGPQGVLEFFQKLGGSTEFDAFEKEAYVAEGSRVVTLGYYTARSKATGKSVTARFAHEWTVENGKVTEFRAHGDTAAIAAIYS